MSQAQWVKRFLRQSQKKRKKMNLDKGTKIRKRVSTKKNLFWTKKTIIDILKNNNIFTLKELKIFNTFNSQRITLKVIKQLFGSWGKLKKHLQPDYVQPIKFSEEDVINVLAMYKILRYQDFVQMHKKNPKYIPSIKYVVNHFGTWTNLKRLVQSQIKQDILKRYMDLKFQMKKYPTKKQCLQRGVQVDVLEDLMTLTELKQFVRQLEKYYVREHRAKNKKN